MLFLILFLRKDKNLLFCRRFGGTINFGCILFENDIYKTNLHLNEEKYRILVSGNDKQIRREYHAQHYKKFKMQEFDSVLFLNNSYNLFI